MRRIFLLAAVLIAATLLTISCGDQGAGNNANKPANAANNTAANTASTANADAEVKKVMTDLAAILAKNDADAAAKFYADDYHLITPAGVDQSKADRLADMRSGATKFDTFAYENVNVRTYGDTAVAIATVKATGRSSNMPRLTDMKATLVFRKMADGWKVVSGQATPITGAAAPANTAANTAANSAANKPANTAANAPANK
jgi:uncharacterized protein (TIGR02246 family)